jgi:hypothetical protein
MAFYLSLLTGLLVAQGTPEYQYGKVGFEEGKQYVITRYDDVEYIGKILQDDDREILIESNSLGKIFVPKYEIRSIIEIVDERFIVFDEYQSTGPFITRYSFTTNALPIKKGENYGMLNIYGPEAHLALTDKLNVGLMTTWIASPIVLATKYSFKTDESNVHFSFGSLIGTSGYLNTFKGFGGLHWLNVTLGDRYNNITLSGGYAYLQLGFKELGEGTYTDQQIYTGTGQYEEMLKLINGPIFSIAGFFKIGAKASFIFDSMVGYFTYEESSFDYFESGGQYYTVVDRYPAHAGALFLMPGVRFQNNDRRALQICVAGVSTFGDISESFPIPMVSWFYKF